jgi:hypothetical protein
MLNRKCARCGNALYRVVRRDLSQHGKIICELAGDSKRVDKKSLTWSPYKALGNAVYVVNIGAHV